MTSEESVEEVIALVIYEDKGGEVFDPDFPDRFHSEFGIFEKLYLLDGVLCQNGCRTSDAAEVETSVLLAGVRDGLRAVPLRDHNHGAAVFLEEIHIGIHTACSSGAERAGCHTLGRLGGTGVIDGVLLEVLGETLAVVEAVFELGVSKVACHDDCAGEGETGRDRILRELLEDFVHRSVEVYFHGLSFESFSVLLGDVAGGVRFELFEPDAFLVDLGLDVAVCRAADADADEDGRTVAGKADYSHVVSVGLAAELGAETHFAGVSPEFLFEFLVAEGVSELIAVVGEIVVVLCAGELERLEVKLGGHTADDDGDVVRRASRGAEHLKLFLDELRQVHRVEDGLRLREEEGLIGRAAAFDHAEELVFVALDVEEVYLGREVRAGIDLFVHTLGRILRVTQVVFLVGVEDAVLDGFVVVEVCPYLCSFFAHDDGCAGVLAERKLPFGRDFGIAQKREGDVAVVVAGLGVVEDLTQHRLVLGTEIEVRVVKSLFGHQPETFVVYFYNLFALELGRVYVLVGEQIILGLILRSCGEKLLITVLFICHKSICVG